MPDGKSESSAMDGTFDGHPGLADDPGMSARERAEPSAARPIVVFREFSR